MRARVLVVDDDPALAEMLTIVLRGEGFDTAVVRDGAKALGVFRETHPDLVLLDLMLPGTSGLDVCKEIRAESGMLSHSVDCSIVSLTRSTRRSSLTAGGLNRWSGVRTTGPYRPDPR